MLESVVASLRRGGSPPAAAGSSSSGNGSGSVRLSPGSPVALLVNNLGATPPSELYVAAGAAARQLQDKHGLCLQRMYAGHFMTSLDMAGVSLTVLDLAAAAAAAGGSPADLLALLDAPTTAPAWPVAQQHEYQPNKARVPLLVPSAPPDGGGATAAGRPAQLSPQGAQLEAAILAACKALVEAAPRLNELDAKVH